MNRFYDAKINLAQPVLRPPRRPLHHQSRGSRPFCHGQWLHQDPPAYYTPKQCLTHTKTAPSQKVKLPPPPPPPHVTTELLLDNSLAQQRKKGMKLFPHNFITRGDNCKKIGMGEATWPEYFTVLRQLAVTPCPPEWWPPPMHI